MITEEQLKKQLTKGIVPPILLIFGEDSYLKKLYVDKISKLTADKDDVFNYAVFGS